MSFFESATSYSSTSEGKSAPVPMVAPVVVKETCSICLDDIERNGSTTLECGHEFHLKCFMELQINGGANRSKCPNCRAQQDLPQVPRAQPQPQRVQPPYDWRGLFPHLFAHRPAPVPVVPVPVRPRNRRVRQGFARMERAQSLKDGLIEMVRNDVVTVQQATRRLGGRFTEPQVRAELNRLVTRDRLCKWRVGRAYSYTIN